MSSISISDLVASLGTSRHEPTWTAQTVSSKITSQPLTTIESQLTSLWSNIIETASADPNQDSLVKFLIALSQLPDVVDETGEVVRVHGGIVWRDLPMFGWEVNGVWNNLTIPPPSNPTRPTKITHFTNTVHFISLLLQHHSTTPTPTPKPTLFHPLRLQLLWTFRHLETPTPQIPDLDLWIQAIAAAISVLGPSIRDWDDDYTPRDPKAGRPGKGGVLWDGGKDGFSGERYGLWKRRVGEISVDEGVEGEVRRVAGEVMRGM